MFNLQTKQRLYSIQHYYFEYFFFLHRGASLSKASIAEPYCILFVRGGGEGWEEGGDSGEGGEGGERLLLFKVLWLSDSVTTRFH